MTSHQYIQKLTKDLTPSLRYDYREEFTQWQQRGKKKLKELLGLPFIKPENDSFSIEKTLEKDDLFYTYFTFQSENGYFVPACLVRKKSLTGKLPLCICLQGHSTGMHISLGESKFDGDNASISGGRDFAVQAAKEGMAAVCMEQRYMGVKGFPEHPYPACSAGTPNPYANQSMAALLIGRTAIGERVWDIMRTIDIVESYFSETVTSEKITCMGNSGGGTATFYVSCLDERISLAVPSCSVCTFEDSIMAMNHCPCNFVPGIRKYFDMGDLGGLIAPKKLLVVCGRMDNIFPLDGVQKSFRQIFKMYTHIGKENSCQLLIGEGGHQFYPDEAWPVIHKLLAE